MTWAGHNVSRAAARDPDNDGWITSLPTVKPEHACNPPGVKLLAVLGDCIIQVERVEAECV